MNLKKCSRNCHFCWILFTKIQFHVLWLDNLKSLWAISFVVLHSVQWNTELIVGKEAYIHASICVLKWVQLFKCLALRLSADGKFLRKYVMLKGKILAAKTSIIY